MFTDENSDKECEYVELSPSDSPNVTRKSLSTIGFVSKSDNQCSRPLALRATQSFTGTLEELKLCSNVERINLCNRTTLSSPKVPAVCPCGCLLRPATTGPFRTREMGSLALHVVPPEVLNHHGYSHQPNQIAMFWKKDCRIFLWKGKSKTDKNTVHANFLGKYTN